MPPAHLEHVNSDAAGAIGTRVLPSIRPFSVIHPGEARFHNGDDLNSQIAISLGF
jgi:hypothetical protein